MIKTLKMFTAVSLLSLVFFALPVYAKPLQQEKGEHTSAPPLTVIQKHELATLHKNLHHMKKQLIAKYLEFGVITPDKARRWSEKLDMHYAKMEKNGFMPVWRECKRQTKD